MRLTERVHDKIKHMLHQGDIAIDATTGNGHDTLFLAQCIGKNGKIFAFDVQQQALKSAQSHLQKHHVETPVTWINAGHENMAEHLPQILHAKIKVITFNLGYLPHTDKSITTCPDTTLPALNASISLLSNGGILSILAYTGHDGGRKECEAIKAWANLLHQDFEVSMHIPKNTRTSPPEWICIEKKKTQSQQHTEDS